MALKDMAVFLAILCLITVSYGMENGLARTPPMGWLAWERFRCNTDCNNNPDDCVSEKLFMEMVDRLAQDGWKDVGYVQVNIDDCWMSHHRDDQGQLVADPTRFESGMKFLGDYIHANELKFGIYADNGNHTCSGYPGSLGYEKVDAQTFASWGVDMLKYDGCSSTDAEKQNGYPKMSHELNATGRPIIFSCSWPAEAGHVPPKINFTLMAEICNLWRNYNDISDSFSDVMDIINWFADNQDVLIPAAGPGHWNDPDMLIGGDYGLSYDQAKLQFGMWAILAAPLFLSADLRVIDPKMRELLQNEQVISIDQDPLGMQGRRVRAVGPYQLWVRPLLGYQQAIAVLSTASGGGPSDFHFSMSILGIENPASKYQYFNIFDNILDTKIVGLNDTITVKVDPQGITMLRATPLTVSTKEEFKETFIFDVL